MDKRVYIEEIKSDTQEGEEMDTNMKSEKVTINVGTMDLAKIDLLVDSLEYSNRSDFCRIAIRELLEKHSGELEKLHDQNKKIQFDSENPVIGGIGIRRLSCGELKEALQKSQKVDVFVTGILLVDQSITTELLDATVENIKVYGKIQASPELLAAIKKKGRQ